MARARSTARNERFDNVRETDAARFAAEDQEMIRWVAKRLIFVWNFTDQDDNVSRAGFLAGGDTWLKALDKACVS
ncbi:MULTISPECIES: hypothetical protein [Bradyrhizobium]|uniref:hypothetical protein n=1 Tax=Bradyrhizobium TaxID=374 RepID=UPI000410FBB8|nr:MULTISPECIES: hypothetical protein [Bradyrhizobium]KQT13226.1 hypothetical protein ASG57_34385 [Bradyrhizobium sp. Leaf396]